MLPSAMFMPCTNPSQPGWLHVETYIYVFLGLPFTNTAAANNTHINYEIYFMLEQTDLHVFLPVIYGTSQLNFAHPCWYTHVPAHSLCVELSNVAWAHIVACKFGMRIPTSEYMQICTSQACTWFATLHMWCTDTLDTFR